MINMYEVSETNKMIESENLDVRTITLGISLLDCVDSGDICAVVGLEKFEITIVQLYTDRGIYRPGQQVEFTGVAFNNILSLQTN